MSYKTIRPWSKIENDNEPPILFIENKSIALLRNSAFQAPEYTCYDNDGANLWHRVKFDTRNLDMQETGNYTVPVYVADRYGNTSNDAITVFVGSRLQSNIRNNPPDGFYDVSIYENLDDVIPIFHNRVYIRDGFLNLSLDVAPDLKVVGQAFYETGNFGFVIVGETG